MATKKTTTATVESKGLRGPQVRILAALVKAKRSLSRKEIAEKAPADLASLVEYVGSHDPERRKANDARKGWDSLVTLGFVVAETGNEDAEGRTSIVYSITAAGKKALEKVAKAEKEEKAAK